MSLPAPSQAAEPAASSRRRLLRRARWVACIVFVALGAYIGLVVVTAWLFLHPLRFGVSHKPDGIGLHYDDVHFASSTDHLQLHGWYIPAEGKPRGLILFCHGRQGNRSTVLRDAKYLHAAGYALFSFDFRACGDSDGSMSTIGYQEVRDALGAVRYLESRPDTSHVPMGIFGVSMGAAVSLQTAAKAPELRCVIADSPFATLDSAIQQRFQGLLGPAAELLRLPVERVGEQMMGIDALLVSPLAMMPKIAPRPILLIHGDQDAICPVGDSRLLLAAAAPGTAQLWIVSGAGHVGAYVKQPEEYRRRVLTFLNTSFPAH